MGLIEDIAIKVLGAKDAVSAFQDLDKGMKRLGMTLRLSGRDWMRMGSSFVRTGTGLMGILGKLSKGSSFLSDWFEEMAWIMEDIGDVIGGQLSPFFEFLVNILETLTDILDANPWLSWLLVIGAVIGLVLVLVGKMMSFMGTLHLLTGTFMTAGEQGLGFLDTLKLIMFGTHSSAQETRTYAAQLAGLGPVMDTISSKHQVMALHLKDYRNSIRLVGQENQRQWAWSNAAISSQVKLTKATKKGAKQQKGLGKNIKGMATPLIGLVGGFFLLMGAMEHLSPIFEALGDVVDIIFEFFEPLIDLIANIIEENPALIATMLLAVIAAIIAMKATDFIGWLKGLFSGVSQVGDKIPSLSTNTGNLAKNIIALAAAVGILMISMAGAIWILDQTSFTIPQIISLMGALTATVIALTGTFIVFGIIMAVTGVTLAPLIPVILALSAAMLGFGAAVFLASSGVALMVNSISGLLTSIRGLRGTRITLFGPFGLPMGGIEIASLEGGGLVKGEGFAYLHPDEVVTPAGQTGTSQRITNYNSFYISGEVRTDEDFERIAKEVTKIQERESRSAAF